MCKKWKVGPESYSLKHYKDGEFHKAYDRKLTVSSLVNFMRDPTGDIPWDEDDSLGDVIHIPDLVSLAKLLRREIRPVMVMFYAPWCGFCKQLKPEYSAAAADLKSEAVLAAIDVNRPENTAVRSQFNITGFPTLLYFHQGTLKYTYEGDNKKDDIVSFMKDPMTAREKPKEEEWSDTANDVVHLTSDNFDSILEKSGSVLVMFYAPWCGHCKKMKPEYEKAATALKEQKIRGVLAALDATKHSDIAKKYGVKGYPTLKYFKNGQYLWDMSSLRDSNKLISFMKHPKEPPPPPPPEPEWEAQPSEVVHLNADNFKSTLRKKKHCLVMFYAPWCGHCKKSKPEFTAAAEEFKDNTRVTLAALDCTKYGSVCKAVGVGGYPSFKYFNYYDRAKQDYSGGRKKNDFVAFMKTMESSSSKPVESSSSKPVESSSSKPVESSSSKPVESSSSKPVESSSSKPVESSSSKPVKSSSSKPVESSSSKPVESSSSKPVESSSSKPVKSSSAKKEEL